VCTGEGSGTKQMCACAAEEINDPAHYVPGWAYNPPDGRGLKKPASQQQAMEELVSVVKTLTPDNFTPKIITQTADYLYVEYESPTFGFIDDVEFYFKNGVCEYRCDPSVSTCLSCMQQVLLVRTQEPRDFRASKRHRG
jgi:hypothetical protein